MGATLYILRQQHDRISPSLFHMTDTDIDIVLMEQFTSLTPSSEEGAKSSQDSAVVCGSPSILTFDDLIEKIFSSEHVVVL